MQSSLAMASATPVISHSQLVILRKPGARFISSFSPKRSRMAVVSATPRSPEKPKKGFAEEMRFVALRMHSKDETKEGEREPKGAPIAKWEPNLKGYLKFLVDSALVYQVLERAMEKAAFPEYAEFKKTGLERSESLAKDLEWFEMQGHAIPQPSSLGVDYARYLDELSENDAQAFICHYYMIYFGHNAGGRMIGKKVEKILKGKQLEFYKYEGDVSQILQNVRDKLDRVSQMWSRKEKDHCLEETEKSINSYGDILRLILT